MEDIQLAIPLGFLLSFMIGPVFFVLLETSATQGFRAGIFFNLGAVVADIFFLLVAYFSSVQLLENLSNQPGLFVFGGMILLVYGIVVFIKNPSKKANLQPSKGTYLALAAKGFLLNFINIGVLVSWCVLFFAFWSILNKDPGRIQLFFGTVIVVVFVTDLVKILLAKKLKRYLTRERLVLIKKGLGLILIICAIVLITKGFLPREAFDFQEEIDQIYEMLNTWKKYFQL